GSAVGADVNGGAGDDKGRSAAGFGDTEDHCRARAAGRSVLRAGVARGGGHRARRRGGVVISDVCGRGTWRADGVAGSGLNREDSCFGSFHGRIVDRGEGDRDAVGSGGHHDRAVGGRVAQGAAAGQVVVAGGGGGPAHLDADGGVRRDVPGGREGVGGGGRAGLTGRT